MTAGTTRDPATVGPYRLVRKLGEGGMGVVHLATDPAGRAVALKVLRAHVANDEEARRRLTREVDTLRRVRHSHVAEVLDADVAGAEPYLVTRFVPGRSLEEEVRSRGALPAGQVARVGRTLAGALAAIHAAGVVHRDVKPANVMLVDDDPVLIDFGIAHVADESRITRTGLVMGTPGYLSPELIYGGGVTPATDWWAWGATLAFAATARQPFGGGPIEVILEKVRRGQSDLDGVEPGLRDLLAATLTVDPSRRPSAAELLRRLDDVVAGVTTAPSAVDAAGRPTAAPDDPTSRTAPPPAAQRPTTTASPPLDRTRRMSPPAAAAMGSAPARPVGVGFSPANPSPVNPSPVNPSPVNPSPVGGARRGSARGADIPPYPGARRSAQPPYPPAHAPYPQPAWSARPGVPPYGSPAPGAPQHGYPHGSSRPQSYGHSGNGAGSRGAVTHPGPPYPQQPTPYPWAASPGAPTPGRAGPQGPHAPSRPAVPPESVRVTGTLAAVALALAAAAAVAPGGVLVTVFCLSVLARLVQRSSAGLQRRRQELGGPRPTDVAVTVAALPWRLFMSVVMSLVALVLPALVAMSTAFVVGSAAAQGGAPTPADGPALVAGLLAGAATAWWGPGGWSLRTGSRAVVRSITRGRGGRIALVSFCALLAIAAFMVAGSGHSPDWGPFPPPGTLVR